MKDDLIKNCYISAFDIEDSSLKNLIIIGTKCLIDNKEDLFNTIPERTNCITYELDEDIKTGKVDKREGFTNFILGL